MTDWEKISVISTSMALCVSAQVEVPPTTTENTHKHSLAILFYVYKRYAFTCVSIRNKAYSIQVLKC